MLRAVRSGWVAPIGPDLDLFEKEVSLLARRKFAVALSSGTAALHLGLVALGVKPGDYVICSTLTFVATANAISYVGAKPVFVDSEMSTGNMSVPLLERAIETVVGSGRKVAAVVIVDFLGSIPQYEVFQDICEKFGIPILADSAESVGATRHGKPAGSFGDAAIFSFNGNKIVTTSGGGAFLTDNSDHASLVRHLANQARETAIHYEHRVIGYNYRLSNLLAAIGRAQIARLDGFIEKRREHRLRYRRLFAGVAGVRVLGNSDFEDNCWLSAVIVQPSVAGFTSEELGVFLETRNIESRPLWKPMHLQPLYASRESYLDGSSETLFRDGLALPSGSSLQEAEWDRLSDALKSFLMEKSAPISAVE